MAKSKLVQSNEKIAAGVVKGYKKIEEGVVGGYKKIEDGAVKGFEKITDQFVGHFLTRDGESIEEAKARLSEQQKREREKTFDSCDTNQTIFDKEKGAIPHEKE